VKGRGTPTTGVLFVTYGAGHVDIVLSLLPRLQALGVPYKVLALTTAPARLRAAGYACTTPGDYLPVNGYEHAFKLGAELSTALWDSGSPLSWEESCAYLGISMVDLIAQYGDAGAWNLYREKGRKAFCPTRFLSLVLSAEQPSVVVTTCHVRMERAAVLAARQLGCPSVLVEDLFGYSLLGEVGVDSEPMLLPRKLWPDAVVVLNRQVKQRLVEAGFPADAVHPFGQPVFSDWLVKLQAAQPCDALADWRIEGRAVLTYAAPGCFEVLLRHSSVLSQIAGRHPEWGLAIKLHPSVGLRSYLEAVGELPQNLRVLPAGQDILPVIQSSDLVIVFSSSVGLLALFAGKPLLVFDDSGEPQVMPYCSTGAAVAASTLSELERAIDQQLVATSVRGEQMQSSWFENPPEASERIAAWLQTFVKQ